MKKLLVAIMALVALTVSGCGDASVAVLIPIGESANPPAITSYQFTKNTLTETINGSVIYVAPDIDLDTMTIVVFDSRGFEVARTKAVLNLQGISQGTVFFTIDYVSYPPDTYTFSICLTDFSGSTSNLAVDTFRVP